MKLMRRAILIFVLVVLIIGAAYAILPWKSWVQHKAIATLEAQGLAPVSFTVDGLGVHGFRIKDVTVGDPAYRLDHLSVSYSMLALLTGDDTAPITITSDTLSLRAGDTPVTIKNIEAKLTRVQNWRTWNGTWKATTIAVTDETLALPPLDAQGTLEVDEHMLHAAGAIESATQSHRAVASLEYSLDDKSPSQLTISEAKMPWGGGVVALTNTTVPIGGKKPTKLLLDVRRVNVESLLLALGADGATATGVVSGNIPVTLLPDGKVVVGKGALNAAEPGIINLPPESIPGDNAQVSLVREVMKNLHYQVLALSLASANDGSLLMKLGVEGKNPDVENGRPVKLNVQLSGDLLNLLLQNIKLMTDPKTFIKQSDHEKNP